MAKIPARSLRYYIKRLFHDQGNAYHDGAIYELTPQQAQTFAEYVENVSFPALEKIELDIDQAVQDYRKQRDDIRTSSRYDSNESERAYQLQQLRQDLDEKIHDLSAKYNEAVQLTRADLAKRSAEIDTTDEARSRAREIVDMAAVQLSFTSNQADVLRLLDAQLDQQDADVKTAVGLQFAKLLPAIKDDTAREAAGAVYSQLESAGMRDFKSKMHYLDILTRDHSPTAAYNQMKLIELRQGGEQR